MLSSKLRDRLAVSDFLGLDEENDWENAVASSPTRAYLAFNSICSWYISLLNHLRWMYLFWTNFFRLSESASASGSLGRCLSKKSEQLSLSFAS